MESRLILAAGLLGLVSLAAMMLGCLRQLGVKSYGSPAGRVIRAGSQLALLMETCDPYMPSLKGVSESDKSYSYSLWLIPETGQGDTRTIALSSGVRSGDRMRATGAHRFENNVLWVAIETLHGVELPSGRLTNRPAPASLVNAPISELLGPRPDPDEPYRARGLSLVPDQWLALATEKEASTDLQTGTRLYTSGDAPRTYQSRTLYRAKIEANPIPRVASREVVCTTEFRSGAFMRSAPGSEIVRFSNPDGFLIMHEGGDPVHPTLRLSRVSTDGTVVWTADTELGRLTQILPHPSMPAFVGERVANAKELVRPTLTVVNLTNGTAKVISLLGPVN